MLGTVRLATLPMIGEATDPRGEHTATTFLQQYNLSLHSEHIHRYMELSTLTKEASFMQQRETVTESYNWSKCRDQLTMRCWPPIATLITTQSLYSKLMRQCEKGDSMIVRARRPGACCELV